MEYLGDQTTDAFISWVSRKSSELTTEVTCEELETVTVMSPLNLVFFGDFTGDLYDSFINVAKENVKYHFFKTTGQCASNYLMTAQSLLVFRSFD